MTRFLLASLLLTLSICIAAYLIPPSLAPSPLGTDQVSVKEKSQYLLLGFAPYWLSNKISVEAKSSLTHYAYFALMIDKNGKLVTHLKPSEQEPGYTGYLKLLKTPPSAPLILTFITQNDETISTLLSSSNSRQTAVTTITSELLRSGAAGVNIDFEPVAGTSSPLLRQSFTKFIQELKTTLSPRDYLLTISIYPSAASRPRLWDLQALSPLTDYFVVMTYDYTLPGAGVAGPNSPLRGANLLFTHDIITNLSELSRDLLPRQILLGIPFYGYEWDVTTADKYARSETRASVASLERIDELAKANVLELLWDRGSLTPYAVRREGDKVISQIYYENTTSIRLKLDLVRSAGLGGIAIWALGYEGNNPELWHTLNSLPR